MVLGVIYGIVIICLVISLIYDRQKTIQAFKMAWMMLKRMIPPVLALVGLVGIIMGLLSKELISTYLGAGSGFMGTLGAALVGTVSFIPSLVAFPFAGSLVEQGASVMTIAAFITTLTMVGVVTAPLEISEFGLRFTLWRNGLSFIFALVLALLVGVIL